MELDFTTTLQALKRMKVQTGSLVCLGCGREHNCSTHGCVILRDAVEHMEAALERYDHWSGLLDQQEKELEHRAKLLAASEAARAELAQRLAAAQKELQDARVERDAILRDLRGCADCCSACKHQMDPLEYCDGECDDCSSPCPCQSCDENASHFEWRGGAQ